MSNVRVFIDLSYLGYRALHSTGDLDYEAVQTGVIFGIFNQLRQIGNHPLIRSNRISIFCDSGVSNRLMDYPAYKQKRKSNRTEEDYERLRILWRQLRTLREVLADIGFPVYEQLGLESDDLMAWAAKELTFRSLFGRAKREAVIVTGDGDLYQCVNMLIHWFDPARDSYVDLTVFQEKYNIVPSRFGEVKAIAGCSTDNVAGVPGVGEPTAIKYLNGELPPRYKAHQSIIDNQELIARNRELVVLPHAETDPFELEEPCFNEDAFFYYCEEFGMVSYLRSKEAWRGFFRGTRFKTRKRRR